MKTATIKDLLSWEPCYSEDKIRELAGGVTEFTALDVLGREDLSVEDRLWVVLRPELIEDRVMHLWAIACAERVVHLNADPRVQGAIEAKRAWLEGKISDQDLDAASAAAWDAAWAACAAARDAAWAASAAARAAASAAASAARAAAWAAAWAASWAARAAAWAWQVGELVRLLGG